MEQTPNTYGLRNGFEFALRNVVSQMAGDTRNLALRRLLVALNDMTEAEARSELFNGDDDRVFEGFKQGLRDAIHTLHEHTETVGSVQLPNWLHAPDHTSLS